MYGVARQLVHEVRIREERDADVVADLVLATVPVCDTRVVNGDVPPIATTSNPLNYYLKYTILTFNIIMYILSSI